MFSSEASDVFFHKQNSKVITDWHDNNYALVIWYFFLLPIHGNE